MEPNNIENQFREKLSSREIKPSAKAWDRLDAMLAVAEKPKRNYRWMYVAASFLGFMLIATVFLNQTEEAIDSEHQKVVFEQNKIEKIDEIAEIPTEVGSNSNKTSIQRKRNVVTNVKSNFIKEKSVSKVVAGIKNSPDSSAFINQKTRVKVNVNALLVSVDGANATSSITKNTVTIKVTSSELLAQVDDELDLSFRERVIQNVNKKFKEVKEAVVNRNLE
jgi:hypothetical protein